jgi:hypothetical protein
MQSPPALCTRGVLSSREPHIRERDLDLPLGDSAATATHFELSQENDSVATALNMGIEPPHMRHFIGIYLIGWVD